MRKIASPLVLGLLGSLTAASAQTATAVTVDKVTGAEVATNETLGCLGRFRWQPRTQLRLCYNRGNDLWKKGEFDRAIEDYTAALRIEPDDHAALINRGKSWERKGEYDRAIEDYTAALRIKPDLYQALHNRGRAWGDKGELNRTVEDFTAALRIKPDHAPALNDRAWVLATAPDARLRDGPRAVRLADKLVSLQDDAYTRDTLAAAYAEAGRFADAVSAQERSLAMGRAEGWSAEHIADVEDRLRLYRQSQPYRELK